MQTKTIEINSAESIIINYGYQMVSATIALFVCSPNYRC